MPVKKPKDITLTDDQKAYNALHAGLRSIGERANTLLKTPYKALRRVSLDPSAISRIATGALLLLHFEHNRTT